MKTSLRFTLLIASSLLFLPLAAAASGGSGEGGTCIASMSASLDSAVLISGSTEVTVISSPTPILLVGDEHDLKGVVSVTIPDGSPTSFDHVRVTLSGITFSTFQACATGSLPGDPDTLTDLLIEFDEEDEDDDTEEITPGQAVSLELSFEPEDGLEPDGAGCFTGTFVSDPAPAFEAEIEDDENEEEDLELSGSVVSVGSSDFVLDVNGVQHTITVDSNTEFDDPLTDLSGLAPDDLVEAEVITQADGTLLATEVELLFDEDGEGGATGRIACVDTDSGPANSLTLVFAPSSPDHPFPSTTITVNLDGSTKFKVNKGNLNTNGFVFDASTLSAGQRLTAAGTTVSGTAPEIDGSKLILKLQMVDGLLVDGSVNTSTNTFQLTVTSASDVLLTEPITIKAFAMTKFVGRLRNVGNLNTTDTYRITGLLMRNASDGTLTLLAKKVKKVKVTTP